MGFAGTPVSSRQAARRRPDLAELASEWHRTRSRRGRTPDRPTRSSVLGSRGRCSSADRPATCWSPGCRCSSSVSLMPPVTMISPSGRIETPGQNMLWAVLLIVAGLTAPVVRSTIAVCVIRGVPVPKLRFSSADHTTSLLPGINAAATGTQREADRRPPLADDRRTRRPRGGACRRDRVPRRAAARGLPVSTILAPATDVAPPGETESTVSRTARTRSALHATFLSLVFACHYRRRRRAGTACRLVDRVTRNRPTSPGPARGKYVRPETSSAAGNLIVIDVGSAAAGQAGRSASTPLSRRRAALCRMARRRAGCRHGPAVRASAGANGIHAAFVGCSICAIAPAGMPLIPMEAGRLPAGTIASARPEHATTATIAATNAINKPPLILRPLTFATLVPRKSDHTQRIVASEFLSVRYLGKFSRTRHDRCVCVTAQAAR